MKAVSRKDLSSCNCQSNLESEYVCVGLLETFWLEGRLVLNNLLQYSFACKVCITSLPGFVTLARVPYPTTAKTEA